MTQGTSNSGASPLKGSYRYLHMKISLLNSNLFQSYGLVSKIQERTRSSCRILTKNTFKNAMKIHFLRNIKTWKFVRVCVIFNCVQKKTWTEPSKVHRPIRVLSACKFSIYKWWQNIFEVEKSLLNACDRERNEASKCITGKWGASQMRTISKATARLDGKTVVNKIKLGPAVQNCR